MNLKQLFNTVWDGLKDFSAVLTNDIDALTKSNELKTFASLEMVIEEIIERTEWIMAAEKEFNERVKASEEMLELAKRDLAAKANKRGVYKAEVDVLKQKYNYTSGPDAKLQKSINNYVKEMKKLLVKAIKKRDRLFEKHLIILGDVENVEELYEVIALIREEMLLEKAAKSFASGASEKVEAVIKGLIKSNKENNQANGLSENAFADPSKLALLQPTLMGLFSRAIQKVGECEFISESVKELDHLVIRYEDHLIKFNKNDLQKYFIFVEGTPLVCGSDLLCSNKEVDDLLGAIGRFWEKI